MTNPKPKKGKPQAKGPVLTCVGCALTADVLGDALNALSSDDEGPGAHDHVLARANPLLDQRKRLDLAGAYASAAESARQFLKLIREGALSIAAEHEHEVRVAMAGAEVALARKDALEKP